MMNKGGRSPYDTKCNVAEIGAVNMGEIGAVRKWVTKVTFVYVKRQC